MRHYSLYRLNANAQPEEIRLGDGRSLDELRSYRNNLQQHNPTNAYWIMDNLDRCLVF